MNIQYIFQEKSFIAALKTFFAELNISMTYVEEKPIPAAALLRDRYKPDSEVHQLIDEVYFLGLMNDASLAKQDDSLFATKIDLADLQKDNNDYDGLAILGITLKPRKDHALPSRSQLADITRAFNQSFPTLPVTIVFKYEHYLAIANGERLKYEQTWREGEKIGKISILKDINLTKTHEGHNRILEQMKLPLVGKKVVTSFTTAYAHWLLVFNTDILNKKFYTELSNWYFWALKEVRFPNEPSDGDAQKLHTHRANNVIRMITRLIFTWFLKEKKLVPASLFDLDELSDVLHFQSLTPDMDTKSTFYQGILQNLFFATLNQEMTERRFKNSKTYKGTSTDFGIKNVYRYLDYFKSEEKALALFENIPFLNGGLFECLDDERLKDAGLVDGFSDAPKRQAQVPNFLFFQKEEKENTNLNEDYGTKGVKYKVRGLIHILNDYKFTIAENTPLEEEVALDPELLGKVFENLLASYNPETQSTARKQTGSFYTPREIVNYMVDESLKAYLLQNMKEIHILPDIDAPRLEMLFAENNEHDFNDSEIKALIAALDNCKILDPACGSGAYPMGILQRMVKLLHKLDPKNERWKQQQLDNLEDNLQDAQALEEARKAVIRAFEYNELDYGRKLYLIENCIYGVDIQPIAVQICKLRFFISLICDQKIDLARGKEHNLDVLALPNLETKFVAANTLIGLPTSNLIKTLQAEKLIEQREKLRHKIFSAKNTTTKKRLREKDEQIRNDLKTELETFNGGGTAEQLANWDPFNQNAFAPFFDLEWMFGLKDGFDVVIGNPPYGFRTVLSKEEKDYFRKVQKIEFSSGDSAELFVKICFDRHTKVNGILSFIIPKKSLYGDAWEDTRINYWKKFDLKYILDTGKSFDNVLLEASVFGLLKRERNGYVELAFLENNFEIKRFSKVKIDDIFVKSNSCQIYKVLYPSSIFNKIQEKSFQEKMIEGMLGLAIGTDFFSDIPKEYKLLKGIDVTNYMVRSNRWLANHDKLKWANVEVFLKPKVITQVIVSHIENPVPHLKITAAFDKEGIAITNTLMAFKIDERITNEFWLAYLNSKFLSWYAYNFIYSRAIRTMHFYNFYIQQIPIPKITPEAQQPFINLVEKILEGKKSGKDTSGWEAEIDGMVYDLYELTAAEIAVVEGK